MKKRTAFVDLYVPADLRPHFGGRTSVCRYLGAVELQEAYRLAAEARLEHERHIRSLEDPTHDQHRLTALTEFRTTVKVSNVEEVTRSHLMQYRDWLKAKGDLSPVTINQRLTWIRTILQQGWDDLGITGFSMRNLKLATPKGTRRQRQWPPEDIITALRALKNQPVDYAWAFLLALTTGCRPAEIAHLRVDWRESVGVFNLPGWAAKNGNQRYLPIIPILHDPLEAFIEQRPEGAYLRFIPAGAGNTLSMHRQCW